MKPKLIHPVDVLLHRQDENTPINFAYDEPDGEMLYLAPQTIKGQVSYKVHNTVNLEGLGNAPLANGYFLCYAVAWDQLGGTAGDLVEIPGDTKCTVVEVRPTAHYKGKHWFYKIFFERLRGR